MKKVSEITVKNLAEYLKLDYSGLGEEEITELATFLGVADNFIKSFTGLTSEEIDTHGEFVIAVYILVADMYENRQLYVDKNKLNSAVEWILNMHSTNLL